MILASLSLVSQSRLGSRPLTASDRSPTSSRCVDRLGLASEGVCTGLPESLGAESGSRGGPLCLHGGWSAKRRLAGLPGLTGTIIDGQGGSFGHGAVKKELSKFKITSDQEPT